MSSSCAKALKKYFGKQKNIDYILRKTNGNNQSLKIYEILCILKKQDLNPSEKEKAPFLEERLERVLQFLKQDDIWDCKSFDLERRKTTEENDFIVCPYEISEGVLECRKCKCKKIFSFSKQTRSIDEPATVFALCSECGHRWCEGS